MNEETEIKSSSLGKRIFSGLVLAPLVVVIILYGSWPFHAMIALAATISIYEWFQMAQRTKTFVLDAIIGTIYIAVCLVSYAFMRFGIEQGAWLALVTVLCVWSSDTGAYIVGKTVGGPKMTPVLSPNKTWAGLGGAMFFCGLTLWLLLLVSPEVNRYIPTNLGISMEKGWLVFLGGCFLGFVGQVGDLFISSIKRRAGVKDTGHIIPGHGGLLDRIDALLLVAPAFLMILTI